jgi:hypothetical protein
MRKILAVGRKAYEHFVKAMSSTQSLFLLAVLAYLTADREALLSFFSAPGKFYVADPYTFLFTGILVLIFGAGKFSLDTLFGHPIGCPEIRNDLRTNSLQVKTSA